MNLNKNSHLTEYRAYIQKLYHFHVKTLTYSFIRCRITTKLQQSFILALDAFN